MQQGSPSLHLPSTPQSQLVAFLVAAALLVVIVFAVYYFFTKNRETEEAPPRPHKESKEKKGKKGNQHPPNPPHSPQLPITILLLLLLLPTSQAMQLSNTNNSANHTYDLLLATGHMPMIKSLTVSGWTGSSEGCACTTAVEISDNGVSYASIGTSETLTPQRFSLSFTGTGAHRFIRITNQECALANTTLNITEKPDLVVTAINVSGEPMTGIPLNITATAQNIGGPLDASPTSNVMFRFYDTSIDQQHAIGEFTLGRNESIWQEGGTAEKSINWMPPVVGTRTLYATVSIYPPAPGVESNETNNIASKGILIQAGPEENRTTSLEVSASPSALDLGASANVRITATYIDMLTNQPILGANCTVTLSTNNQAYGMNSSGTGYAWEWAQQSLPVGVTVFSASCIKEGHSGASNSAFLAVNSPNGQKVTVQFEEGVLRGTVVMNKKDLGGAQKLRVYVERSGPEIAGFDSGSLRINNHRALAFSTDAHFREGRYWLEENTTSAEWIFNIDYISGDYLNIIFEPELIPAVGTMFTMNITPVRVICSNRPPEAEIIPAEKSGEVGTPLYYQLIIHNKDTEDCPPTDFYASQREGRVGWKYSFSTSHLLVAPGKSNITFLSVEPPLGESPGSYKFKFAAEDNDSHAGTSFSDQHIAEGTYSVSSPKLFAALETNVSEPVQPAGPGAVFTLTARYYNITNGTIGSCKFVSDFVGPAGAQMGSNGTHFLLELNLSKRSTGNYPYIIECEAQDHKSIAYAGNLTLLQTASPMRYPELSISPVVQQATGNSTVSFATRIRNKEDCTGERQFSLSAAAPTGWASKIEGDSPEISCGDERESAIHLTPPANNSPAISFVPITANYLDDPRFATTAYGIIASAPQRAKVLSCLLGDADESAQNLEFAGDPCSNFNIAHNYILPAPQGRIYITGRTAGQSCEGIVAVEASIDGIAFSKVAEIPATSSSDFVTSFASAGYSRIRIKDEKCRIARTAIMYLLPDITGSPELSILGVDSPMLVQGAAATVKATVRNSGTSAYSSYTTGLVLRNAAGETTPLDFRTTYSHASGTSQEIEFHFIPQVSGRFEIAVVADYANEINESDEGGNSFAISNVEISSAPRYLTVPLSPGWNFMPFINGALATHNCTLLETYAYEPTARTYLTLDSTGLSMSNADFDNYTALHGTMLIPKGAGAFGGAWAYSNSTCELAYRIVNASSQSQQAFSTLPLNAGENAVAILPWMIGNTAAAAFGSCGTDAWVWNAKAQSWAKLSPDYAFSQADEGKAVLLKAGAACHLG